MAEPTTYVVLREVDIAPGERAWMHADSIEASSAEAAIRKSAARADKPEGTYVATPTRSFQPLTVKAQTQTVITLAQRPDASSPT